jgi:8-oxo-dGTP pyrophosphatase MutT (NUDIX family)
VSNADEIVSIVNERNEVIGSATRGRMRAQRLRHRACYVFVFDAAGRLFVQRRTATKDIYPGFHDVAAGGVVQAEESYEECAARELEEEMGIRGAALSPLFDFYYEDHGNRVWGRAYSCTHDGPVTLQKEEVASGDFLPLAEVLALAEREPFTPDGLCALRRYLACRTPDDTASAGRQIS